jgi:hypothetical protein
MNVFFAQYVGINFNSLRCWWFGTFLFSPIVGMMIQSDELIFFRGVGQPPISLDVDNYIPSGNLT